MVDMSAALEKLKREITCSLCLDLYEDPKLLPCLHYYCQKCINPMVTMRIHMEYIGDYIIHTEYIGDYITHTMRIHMEYMEEYYIVA